MSILYLLLLITLLGILPVVTILISLRPVVFRLETSAAQEAELMGIVDDLWHPWVLHVRADRTVFLNLLRLPFWWLLHRPPENSISVIHLFDRLWYMAGPNEWVLVVPRLHAIGRRISLRKRRADVFMTNRLSKDGIPMDVRCMGYFQVDLRWAKADFRLQALEYNDEIWRQIIETSLINVANEIIAQLTMQEILASDGKKRLKGALSVMLAKRARTLGMITNPRYGVMVESVLPAKKIWDAMAEKMAAPSLGDASRVLVEPVIEIAKQHTSMGWELLLIEMAAAVARGDPPPQALMSSRDGWDGIGLSRVVGSNRPSAGLGGFRTGRRNAAPSEGL